MTRWRHLLRRGPRDRKGARHQRVADEPAREDLLEERRRRERHLFRDRQEEPGARIALRVRNAYEQGAERTWRELLASGQESALDLEKHPGLLESATSETHLAASQEDLPYEDR